LDLKREIFCFRLPPWKHVHCIGRTSSDRSMRQPMLLWHEWIG